MLTKQAYFVCRWLLLSSRVVAVLASSLYSFTCSAQPQTNYQRVLSFGPTRASGIQPRGRLLEGADGFLYGTAYTGGSSNLGAVFKMDNKGGNYSVLHSFSDGEFPYSGLIQVSDGTLYGTTTAGGAHNGGTLFKLQTDGSGFAAVLDFGATNGDVVGPLGGLIQGADGWLYGTSSDGGLNGFGAVYKVTAAGSNYSILYNFGGLLGGNDGSQPAAALFQGADGVLYGTTEAGGSNNMGTVFKLGADGSTYQILHHFMGTPGDGRMPLSSVVQGIDGFLYGTTYYGGANDIGAIFKMDTNGNNFAVLRDFSGPADGDQPVAGLTRGSDGTLYGTTRYGGPSDAGVAFRVNGDGGGFIILHAFSVLSEDGAQPFAPLMIGNDGALYGNTFYGGAYLTNGANGTVFRLFSYPPLIRIESMNPSTTGVGLNFSGGAAGQIYQIQAAADLSTHAWQVLGSATATIDGSFQFIDPSPPTNSARFYRSALP